MPTPWFGPSDNLRRVMYCDGPIRVVEYQVPNQSWMTGRPSAFLLDPAVQLCAGGRFLVSIG